VSADDRGLVVALNAPPEKGKANEELIDFLAVSIGISRSAIAIARGSRARLKLIQIAAAAPEAVANRIRDLADRSESK